MHNSRGNRQKFIKTYSIHQRKRMFLQLLWRKVNYRTIGAAPRAKHLSSKLTSFGTALRSVVWSCGTQVWSSVLGPCGVTETTRTVVKRSQDERGNVCRNVAALKEYSVVLRIRHGIVGHARWGSFPLWWRSSRSTPMWGHIDLWQSGLVYCVAWKRYLRV